MIIRHAEKPTPGVDHGVDADGSSDTESLTPRGWQRAGALVGLFAGGRLPTPTHLFASKVGPQSSSRRPLQTLQPLSERLRVPTDTTFLKEELGQLVRSIEAVEGVALVSWEHHLIPAIANGLLGTSSTVPQIWPDDRFDLVWLIDLASDDGSGRFRQVPQLLLHGDLESIIDYRQLGGRSAL
jgi:broad specificity phosphatase PhoE